MYWHKGGIRSSTIIINFFMRRTGIDGFEILHRKFAIGLNPRYFGDLGLRLNAVFRENNEYFNFQYTFSVDGSPWALHPQHGMQVS
jgi:hypothetical protein